MPRSLGTKAVSLWASVFGWRVRGKEVGACGGMSWGLPGCRRGDQRPQVTSDPRSRGALQKESFDCRGYGRMLTQEQAHIRETSAGCCWRLRANHSCNLGLEVMAGWCCCLCCCEIALVTAWQSPRQLKCCLGFKSPHKNTFLHVITQEIKFCNQSFNLCVCDSRLLSCSLFFVCVQKLVTPLSKEK